VKTSRHEMDMCNGPLLKKMILFAIPVIVSSVLQMVYNAADMVIIGRFGSSTALASVGATSHLINLLVGLFNGVSVGASVVVAQSYGADDVKNVHGMVHTSITMSMIFGLFIMAAGLLFSRQMLLWMDTPADVIEGAVMYLNIYFLGIPAMMIFNFAASIMRAVGDTKRPMYYQILSGALNVVLNLVFVIGFKWDVVGVAASTTLSQYLCCGLVLWCMTHTNSAIRLDLRRLHMNVRNALKILRIGLPSGVHATMFSVANVMIQSGLNSFGAAAIAANSAAGSIEGFVSLAFSALYTVNLSFAGQNMGAKKYDRIDKICKIGVALSFLCWIVLGGPVYLLRKPLLSIYTTDPEVIRLGALRITIMLSVYFVSGLSNTFVGTLRGIGYATLPMINTIFGVCVFRLIWLATAFAHYHTLVVLYLSYPISWTITAVAHIINYLIIRKKVFKREEPSPDVQAA